MVKISSKPVQAEPRKINTRLYALAFLITALIFLGGIYVGTQIDAFLFGDIRQDLSNVSERMTAIELLLLTDDSGEFCGFFREQIDLFGDETYRLGAKIGFLENEKGTVDQKVKDDYFMLEIRDYFLVKKFRESCDSNVVPVLYFLSSKDCPTCFSQGEQLTDARLASKGRMKVYSFDVSSDSSAVRGLMERFRIDSVPTIVLDETKKEGFTSKEEILSMLPS